MTTHPLIQHFMDEISIIRKRLADANCSGEIVIQLQAEGYPCHSEFAISFSIRERGHTEEIIGTDPHRTCDEFLRRYNYNKENTVLLLGPSYAADTPEFRNG